MLATLDPRKPAWILACAGMRLRFGVRPDAFGNALGGALVDSMMPQNSAQQSFRSGEIAEQNAQARSDMLYGLGSGDSGMGLRQGGGSGLSYEGLRATGSEGPSFAESTAMRSSELDPLGIRGMGGSGSESFYDDTDARRVTPGAAARLQRQMTEIRQEAQARERAEAAANRARWDAMQTGAWSGRTSQRAASVQVAGPSMTAGDSGIDWGAALGGGFTMSQPEVAGGPTMGYVEQMANLSNALHVPQGFMKNSFDRAMSGMTDSNNSWLDRGINLLGATAMLPLTGAEELMRGALNLPSAAAGAVPQASQGGTQLGMVFDSSLPTDQRVIAGLRATTLFTSAFDGLAGAAVALKPSFEIGMPPASRVSLNELGPVENLLYGARVGEGLPGSTGVPIAGRPTAAQLESLTVKHDVEFAVTYQLGAGKGGGGGQYFLYSGEQSAVQVPLRADTMLISHTHPGGTPWASTADMRVMRYLEGLGSPQRSSQIVPVGKDVIRFNGQSPRIK